MKTYFYSALSIFITILFFSLTERMAELIQNAGNPGFSSIHYFIHEIFLVSLNIFAVGVISFSLIYFSLPEVITTRKLILFGSFYMLFFIIHVLTSIYLRDKQFDSENASSFFALSIAAGFLGGFIRIVLINRNSFVDNIENNKKLYASKTALLLLQSQLNPHFLFNSLNNIDILVEENPKKASDYLKKLSDILRYVLYETKEDETDVAKEIEQIKSFIELQKIRSDNPYYVNFNIKGELKGQKIAPMIFIPFVENAFKHCKNKSIENAIAIEFEISKGSVTMICKNYYETNQLEIIKNEGLGIETIKQRLNLLYPNHHELVIDKTGNWFNVYLSIQLKNVN